MEYVKEIFNPDLDLRFNDIDKDKKNLWTFRFPIDPDDKSLLQKHWHSLLWNKDKKFNLTPEYESGVWFLLNQDGARYGSDWMNSSYTHYVDCEKKIFRKELKVTKELEEFETITHTIGNYIIFPRRDNSINFERGRYNGKIKDRFDLTLECIRLFYMNEQSPLFDVLKKDDWFFKKFKSFQEYVDFFLLEDMVSLGYKNVISLVDENPKENKKYITNESFKNPLPYNDDTDTPFKNYIINVSAFIKARGKRMKEEIII